MQPIILRKVRKQKIVRGIPRKAHNPNRKARYARYLAQATCLACHLLFRTSEYRKAHEKSVHVSMIGLSKRTPRPLPEAAI
jgi:hypothetical protein